MRLMKCVEGAELGRVGNIAKPNYVEVVSRKPLPLGTYISIQYRYEDTVHCLVGVVSSTSFKRTVPVSGPETLTSSELINEFEEDLSKYSISYVRIVADMTLSRPLSPRIPPPPNAPVYLASSEVLTKLFSSSGEGTIRIGHLLGRPDVPIHINVNALTKHLFITGTTGSGKSNTVAVLIDRIASLGGMVIVFDVHGEYVDMDTENPYVKIKKVDLHINPLKIPPSILAKMIIPEASATIQRRLVLKSIRIAQQIFSEIIAKHGITAEALKKLGEEYRKPFTSARAIETIDEIVKDDTRDTHSKFVELFKEYIVSTINSTAKGKAVSDKSKEAAIMKVEEFFEYTSISFNQPSPIDILEPRTIVVLNASALDDEQRDYMLKVVLDEVLWNAKKNVFTGTLKPVVVVIEEAHLFLSLNRESISKRSIERLAREGRKFGVSLVIVSQRPRNIDTNTVSQIQNFVFMKLVQESDQQAVMNASDMLTDDLARSLSSMDTGEAILLGEWVGKFPAYVKIDLHRGKRSGATPDIVTAWQWLLRDRGHHYEEMHINALKDISHLMR